MTALALAIPEAYETSGAHRPTAHCVLRSQFQMLQASECKPYALLGLREQRIPVSHHPNYAHAEGTTARPLPCPLPLPSPGGVSVGDVSAHRDAVRPSLPFSAVPTMSAQPLTVSADAYSRHLGGACRLLVPALVNVLCGRGPVPWRCRLVCELNCGMPLDTTVGMPADIVQT
jgi:hypothetical protein